MCKTKDQCHNLPVAKCNAHFPFQQRSHVVWSDPVNLTHHVLVHSGEQWRKIVWAKVWDREDEDYEIMFKQPHQNYLLTNVTGKPYYIVWWIIADAYPARMRMCETMASLLSDSSLLKATDYRLKKKPFGHKICTKCDLWVTESLNHIVMQCPHYYGDRVNMISRIKAIGSDTANRVVDDAQQFFYTIMGKQPENSNFASMVEIWLITGECISAIYKKALVGRS